MNKSPVPGKPDPALPFLLFRPRYRTNQTNVLCRSPAKRDGCRVKSGEAVAGVGQIFTVLETGPKWLSLLGKIPPQA